MTGAWDALILAAGRGPDDPMAKAYGVANKCVIPVAGVPMLARVAQALESSGLIGSTVITIEDAGIATRILPGARTIASVDSAPGSVIAALRAGVVRFPCLVTTGDHALLTPAMVRHFCQSTEHLDADVSVGLATSQTILAAYPQSVRTFFNLGGTKVSGCNLFGLRSEKAIILLERWQYLEQVRKKPWRLIAAFGLPPLVHFLAGTLTPERAFAIISRKLGLTVRPVFMPMAEAAIDVDKPLDKDLAEEILAKVR